MAYYNAKRAAERRIEESGLPYSILRATQFHSLIAALTRALTRLPVVAVMPKGLVFQPTAIGPVADRLVALALDAPQGRVADMGGPAVSSLPELVTAYLRATGGRRRVWEVPLGGRFLRAMRAGYNTTPELFAEAWQGLRARLPEYGKDPDTFPNALATMWCYITDDRAEADGCRGKR
jgi:uncharacterized protein YbjT (DUF2867 family)